MPVAPRSEELAGIDSSPLSGPSANFRTTALREPDLRRLLVVPSLGLKLAAVALVAAGLGVPAWLLARAGGDAGGLVGTIAFCQIFTLCGALFWLLPRRFEFDLDVGTARVWSLAGRTEIPLSDILAVQVIDGGVHTMSKGGSYRTYQLNLVVAGAAGPRLGVSNHADRGWTYAAGRRIAEFLSVPLLAPAATGDPVEESDG